MVMTSLVLVVTVGCTSSTNAVSDSDGYGDAVAVLYVNSADAMSEPDGRVVIVEASGETTVSGTAGVTYGPVAKRGESIFLSDSDSDYRIDRGAVVKVARDEFAGSDMMEGGFAIPEGYLSVFNVGTKGTGRYFFKVALWAGDPSSKPVLLDLKGNLWGTTVCRGVVHFLVGNWQHDRRAPIIQRLNVKGEALSLETVGAIDLPRGRPEVSSFDCAAGKASAFVELSTGHGRTRRVLSTMDVRSRATSWQDLSYRGSPRSTPLNPMGDLGVSGGDVLFLDPGRRVISKLDIETAVVKEHIRLAAGVPDGEYMDLSAVPDGREVLVLEAREGHDPDLVWIRISDGMEVRRVTAEGVGEMLWSEPMAVTGMAAVN